MRLLSYSATQHALSVKIQPFRSKALTLWYEFASPVAASSDAAVIASVLPSMATGESLQVDVPVSAALTVAIPQVQVVALSWWPEYFKPIAVSVAAVSKVPPVTDISGAFYSLGVDSSYTALTAPGLTHLLFMAGVEYPSPTLDRGVEARVRDVAGALQKAVITGRTNLREVFPLAWPEYYHGAGLASVAVAAGLREGLISSAHAINHLFFWGSHRLLDPLWSTEATRIVHYDDISRAEKTVIIGTNQTILSNLRVCVTNKGGGLQLREMLEVFADDDSSRRDRCAQASAISQIGGSCARDGRRVCHGIRRRTCGAPE